MNARGLVIIGLGVLVAFGAGLVGVWQLGPPPDPTLAGPSRPPNVLLIVWDTVRADRMSLYGHTAPTTPGLERFAREARVFDRAISPATWTVPSHASIFTGQPVSTHGADADWRWVDHHHVTLAEHLGVNGYRTLAVSANPYLSPHTNLLQGFETRRLVWDADRARTEAEARAKLIPGDRSTEVSPDFPRDRPDVLWDDAPYKEAAHIANQHLLDWLRVKDDRPWFAFFNLMEAHSPRIPSLKARRAVMGEELVQLGLRTDASVWTQVSAILGQHEYTREELLAMRGVYDATLVELDAAFTELMAALDERGVLDDTIVVLTSDHGESLGEHGLFEHRYGVWQTLVGVPLLVRYPSRMTPGRVTEPVSTASIYPTILDLAGLHPPRGRPLPRSLVRSPRGPVFTQLTDPFASKLGPFRKAYPQVDLTPWMRTWDAMVKGSSKLVRDGHGAHTLYDLDADPGELVDRGAGTPEAAALIQELDRWRRVVPKADPTKRTPADQRDQHGSAAEDEAMRAMLGMLGYVEEEP